ncbi:MAG: UDP-2,3-diacylglucosamine diphosphatase LpxI [Lentisphaerae bacterium]|nr:UDP-2,3-diacylglucosamine diphosphatase LpxI [Lentisphaerota bacterium]
MKENYCKKLGLIAGRGEYPVLLAQAARSEGVEKIFAVAFKKETKSVLAKYVDEIKWFNVGQLSAPIAALKESGVAQIVMAGQITPTHLFRVRFDKEMLALISKLTARNAHTIFGAICDELTKTGFDILPASSFMKVYMPNAGLLTKRIPTESEQHDIKLGIQIAETMCQLDIGQTVVLKQGTILAIEAFEGTNEAIKRGSRLAGPGIVVVKLAKEGHDMRFDIPVIGTETISLLKKARATVLAVEANRTILLEREIVIAQADKSGISLVVVAKYNE